MASINRALVAGEAYRSVANRFECSASAVFRHRRSHMLDSMLKAREAEEREHGGDLLADLQGLHERTLAILTAAEHSGDDRTALAAIREVRANIELTSKLTGQLAERHYHLHATLPPDVLVTIAEELPKLRAMREERAKLPSVLDGPHVLEGEAALPRALPRLDEEDRR